MKYNTYLFDFDGTLVDSMPSYISVMLRILDENNIKYGKDVIKIITPLGYAGTAKYFREKLGLKLSEKEILSLMNKYAYEEYALRIPAKKNVVQTLKKLKDMGASLNVLTASPHSVLDVCLKRIGIYDLFTNVWSCDDFSTTKADVEIYNSSAVKIGKPIDEILFLDDNFNAVKTAVQSGIKVCGVYDASSHEYTDEIKNISHHYIKDFSELIEL
ncbi:MAG: HAD family hydrolase [Clostridia bacterium]|nr:HAD family hydrolase [Clostridia bacterium]